MKQYEIVIGGVPHTVQLSDEDAERYGDRATEVKTKVATAPKNKSA